MKRREVRKHVFQDDYPEIYREFTLTSARLVLNVRDSYDPAVVRRAAIWMLGSLEADSGDMDIAKAVLEAS